MDLTVSQEDLEFVFGAVGSGLGVEDAALLSQQEFVRSQDHLAPRRPNATGRVLSAWEALNTFGFSMLLRAMLEGNVAIAEAIDEPSKTLRERRVTLGLSRERVARAANVSLAEVQLAERSDVRSPIRTLERIAQALGLDERLLSITPGSGGDEALAVRLKSLNASGPLLTPESVVALDEAAWVIATQSRLQDWLLEDSDVVMRKKFEPSANYGSFDYPAWEHGYFLAHQTRKILGIGDSKPILNLRTLCEETLEIPLIQLELPERFAGATIANNGVRGIAVNTNGANGNVWTRRLTIAHELGHLLWDPDERLKTLAVDRYEDITRDPRVDHDYVEQRANAFAVELLAPQAAASKLFWEQRNKNGLRIVMEQFGISFTAARFHVWNGLDRRIPFNEFAVDDVSPTAEWIGRESYGADYFPLPSTPISRRGEFAGAVIAAVKDRYLSLDTGASYLRCDTQQFVAGQSAIEAMFSHWMGRP